MGTRKAQFEASVSVDYEKILQELFRYAYMLNCELVEEELSPEELETLNDLDTAEVLENFKDLVTDLLEYKRSSLKTEKSDLIQQNEQFEGMLQKLEAEVRNHIRIEQQLKLHLESSQAKLEEAEKTQASLKEQLAFAEAKLSSYSEPLGSPTARLEKQLKALEEQYKHEISRLTFEHTSAIKKHSRHNRVSSEIHPSAVRSQQSRQSPIQAKKPDERLRGHDDNFDLLRQKLDEKSKELMQMHKALKGKTKDQLSERIKDEVIKEELEIMKRLSKDQPLRPESRLSSKPTSAHKKSRSASQSSYKGVDRRQRSQKAPNLM